ncbi:hypothetical protein [Mycolicibacterium porcinum]|uniref:Fe-S cluster assembly protein HesB n=1 Tax=Mycolicibacterium porcinum TaxID=39693 RepID=A0ABV3VQY6_9MYCO
MEIKPEAGKPDEVAVEVQLGVGDRARVHPGTSEEQTGVVVEDFGDDAGLPVDVGGHHIADAARRWAVSLDDGNLVFVDDTDIVADKTDPAALKTQAAQDRDD